MLLSIALNPKKCIADSFLVLPRHLSAQLPGASPALLYSLLVLPWRKRLLKLGQRLSYLKRNGFEELDFHSL